MLWQVSCSHSSLPFARSSVFISGCGARQLNLWRERLGSVCVCVSVWVWLCQFVWVYISHVCVCVCVSKKGRVGRRATFLFPCSSPYVSVAGCYSICQEIRWVANHVATQSSHILPGPCCAELQAWHTLPSSSYPPHRNLTQGQIVCVCVKHPMCKGTFDSLSSHVLF